MGPVEMYFFHTLALPPSISPRAYCHRLHRGAENATSHEAYLAFETVLENKRMITRISEEHNNLVRTPEFNFNEPPRATIRLIHNRIMFGLNVAFHPPSLGGGNNPITLHKSHSCIGAVGFPTDYEI
jgi:hypothetical protein